MPKSSSGRKPPAAYSNSDGRPPIPVSSPSAETLVGSAEGKEKRQSGLSDFGFYIQNTLRESFHSLSWDDEKVTGYESRANRVSVVNALTSSEKGAEMSEEEIKRYLKHVVESNQNDINFPHYLLDRAEKLSSDPDIPKVQLQLLVDEIKEELRQAEENSPYPEVRAVVPPTDDPNMPVGTFRAWTIGTFLVIFGTGLNQFFAPRLPAIGLSITFAQLVAHPIGLFMARVLPTRQFVILGQKCSLNPGPWNHKEHMLISILANVSCGGAYVTDIIAVLRVDRFYNNQELGANIMFQILMAVSSQMIGFSLAGITRRFLVYPAQMIWWGNLVEISVLTSLHSNDNPAVPAFGRIWRVTRYKVFMLCTIVYGIYFILPDVFFQSLSFFNWTTWISPNNAKLAMITGTVTGLGIAPLPTLDWNFMATSPIVTPLFSILNSYAGALVAGVVIIPAMYFTNTLFTAYLPINSNRIFDRTGSSYNISQVLNAEGILDQKLYEAYSPPFISAAQIVVYISFFALYTSTVTHAILYHRKEIVSGFKSLFGGVMRRRKVKDEDAFTDIHYRLMSVYPEVPEWWFVITGLIAAVMAAFMLEYYKTQMPLWGLGFAFAIALFLIVPIGIMTAVASVEATLNVIAELVGGYALPGRPLANMLFKTYGYITLAQAIGYASDMKLAHYAKIPPRQLFYAQTFGTIVSAVVSVLVLDWQVGNFKELCSPTEPHHFTCPGYNTFFTASIVWGAIGPYRLFTGPSALYSFAMAGFAIGPILTIIPWFFYRKYPRSMWKYVHMPAALSGALTFAPLNLAYLTPAIPLAFFFQSYIKPRYTAFYEKYALTFTAGLGASTALFGLLYFFLFQFNGQAWSWVGNNIPFDGCDGSGCTLLTPTEPFGPSVWH